MKILIASSIDGEAIDLLRQRFEVDCAFHATEEELKSRIPGSEILIFRSGVQITAAVMKCAPELKLIVRAGSGLDNIDLPYVEDRGLELVRIPGPGAQAVAEMTFALMLALARNLLTADRLLRQGRWAKYELSGYLLRGKTLGIIGSGNIGTRVGQLGAAWGMKPVGCVEFPSPKRAAALLEKGIVLKDLRQVLATADFVSIHVPLKDNTRNLIDAEALSLMKPGSFLVNIARGGVLDESALKQELAQGTRLRGAAIDVHENEGEGKISPLAGLPNVILTPHIGAMAVDSQREIGRRIVEIVSSFADQGRDGTS